MKRAVRQAAVLGCVVATCGLVGSSRRVAAQPAPPSANATPTTEPDKSTCVAAYLGAQQARLDGHLRAAHDQLALCALETCPVAVKFDCRQWLNEVTAQLPTVVFGARSPDGKDIRALRVSVDQAVTVERADGRPTALDPGEHQLRFEAPGFEVTEETIVAQQGEHDRVVVVTLRPLAQTAAPSATPAPPRAAEVRPRRASTGLPTGSYVLGGAGLAAAGLGSYLLLSGIHDAKHLQETCKPACAEADVSAARTKIVAGNIGVGVGILAIAGAVWLALEPAASEPQTSRLRSEPAIEPSFAGPTASAWLGVRGRF